MKIIQLCAIDQTISIFLKDLIKKLIDEGHEVVCVCSNGKYSKDLKDEGINLINIPFERSIKPISFIITIYKLYKLFKSEKPDIVHVHTPIAGVLGRIASKLAKVPITIYTSHGFYFHENMNFIKYYVCLFIEKFMAKYLTDYIFTQSKEDKVTALKYKFIDKNEILCIGNGIDVWGNFNPENIDINQIEELHKELNISKDNIIITFIGRLVREKGILDLINAFSNIKDNKVKLLIVGDVDQGCRDKKTKEKILKVNNENIIFTGFRNDINNILYLTDIFCLPSYREGVPRTIIEAMAMECAVIATNIRGCREEVIDKKTGFLVSIGSSCEITDKIDLLLRNKKLLNKMKKEGRKRAVMYFNQSNCIDKQFNVMNVLYKQYINK